MIKLIYHDFGTSICVGIIGDDKLEIEQNFWGFWNHKATSGELSWQKDEAIPYFAYFWSSKEAMLKAYESMEFFKMDEKKYKGKKGGFFSKEGLELIKSRAAARFAAIEPERFLMYEENPIVEEDYFEYKVAYSTEDIVTEQGEKFEQLIDKANA